MLANTDRSIRLHPEPRMGILDLLDEGHEGYPCGEGSGLLGGRCWLVAHKITLAEHVEPGNMDHRAPLCK